MDRGMMYTKDMTCDEMYLMLFIPFGTLVFGSLYAIVRMEGLKGVKDILNGFHFPIKEEDLLFVWILIFILKNVWKIPGAVIRQLKSELKFEDK